MMYKNSSCVDILYFIEHKDREFEAACTIAKMLQSKYGLSVAIASTIFHSLLAALFVRPRVLVSPAPNIGRGSVISLFKAIYGDKITYVNLNLEQFLSAINRSVRIPKDPFTKFKIKQFCWGKRFKEFLVSSGVPEKNVFITGKPAICLLQNRMLKGKKQIKKVISEQFALPEELRWFFFPMSCGMAFLSDYHLKKKIYAGWDEKLTWSYKNYVNTTLNDIFKWIVDLKSVISCKDYLIILRPHPSVSVKQYEERFFRLFGYIPSYIHISKALSAHDWLLASDACYVTLSSVAIDSNIIGLPTFRLEPKPLPSFLRDEEWLEGLPPLTSFDEFYSSVAIDTPITTEKIKGIDGYIDLKLNAINKTAEYLAYFAKHNPSAPWSLLGFVKAVYSCPRRYIGSVLRYFAAKTDLRLFRLLPSGLRPDYFNRNDVIKQFKRII